MLGLVSNYNTTEHTIIGGELSRWVGQLTNGDPRRKNKLFLMRYNQLGVFVIAEWLGKPKDVFVDVMNLGKSLGDFGHDETCELRKRLFAPLTAEATRVAVANADSNYHHNLQDEDAEESERVQRVAIGE